MVVPLTMLTNAIENHISLVHLPYISHTLQLSIKWGLQVPFIARVLGGCKKLAQQFRKSIQLTYSLREKWRLLSGRQSLELVQSCPTRWGSTYLMLKRIQVLQQPLCAVTSSPGHTQLFQCMHENSPPTVLMQTLKRLGVAWRQG